MSKGARDRRVKKKYGYDTGFMGVKYNSREKGKEKSDSKLTVVSAKTMTGNELEEFLEQYGAQFPITVGFHNVEYNPETQEMSYIDVLGTRQSSLETEEISDIDGLGEERRKISREKAKAYRDKQARQGTLQKSADKEQDKTEGTR